MPVIALDVMSGDAGLQVAVDAAAISRRQNPDWDIILVGEQKKIEQALAAGGNDNSGSNWQIVNADNVISMDDSPAQAVRRRNTSMRRTVELVAEKKADAAVSAGNTGALMGLGVLLLRPIDGISRPAIAAFMPNPTPQHACCMLDLGANATCTPEMLRDFALMGSALVQSVKKVAAPRVGLLNIGEEAHKGNDTLKQAAQLLRDNPHINFIGNVEGYAVYSNEDDRVDVLVCDGFSGNVALKVSEGLAKMITKIIKNTLTETLFAKISSFLIYPLLVKLRQRLDHRQYNGASLLGLRNVVVKSHGNADKIAFAAAIQTAINAAEKDLPGIIASHIVIDSGSNGNGKAKPANSAESAEPAESDASVESATPTSSDESQLTPPLSASTT